MIGMTAITLWQPWATLIALGLKRYETRSWSTRYRGPLAIHAAKRAMTRHEEEVLNRLIYTAEEWGNDVRRAIPPGTRFPLGVVVATCTLADCLAMDDRLIDAQTHVEQMTGDWQPGRYAWKLDDVTRIDPPVAMRGGQGLWTIR